MNLMRPLTAWLENDYCSITVANHRLIIVIRFVAKNYIHFWIFFINRLHLILHACEILFSKNVRAKILARSKNDPYPLMCHNHCLILMFSNVACEPLSTFSHFSHYPFLMLTFHYSYLQCRDVYISLVFSVSHNSYSIRLVNTYFLDSQCYPHHKSHLLCCKAIAALSTQYSPPSPIQSHLSKLENFHLPP